jgi:hypothetical protein
VPQIDFPPEQREPKSVHYVLLAIAAICIVLVVIINNA